jgi:hypothetical protein
MFNITPFSLERLRQGSRFALSGGSMVQRMAQLGLSLLVLLLFAVYPAVGDSATSYTGSLANSSDIYSLVFNVGGTTSETVTVQTWSFGGGVNAAGATIAAGGFDPFVAIFDGTGPAATIATDGLGNPFGTSDALSNYANFAGCPPAHLANIGGALCGDVTMALLLGPGTYTLVLSDAVNDANAVFDNGTLGEGFSDFTGGVFQTCNTNDAGATICANDTSNFAFDLTTRGRSTTPTPEPSAVALLATGLLAAVMLRCRK